MTSIRAPDSQRGNRQNRGNNRGRGGRGGSNGGGNRTYSGRDAPRETTSRADNRSDSGDSDRQDGTRQYRSSNYSRDSRPSYRSRGQGGGDRGRGGRGYGGSSSYSHKPAAKLNNFQTQRIDQLREAADYNMPMPAYLVPIAQHQQYPDQQYSYKNRIISNFFSIQFDNNTTVTQYDVSFEANDSIGEIQRSDKVRLFNQARDQWKKKLQSLNMVFDGDTIAFAHAREPLNRAAQFTMMVGERQVQVTFQISRELTGGQINAETKMLMNIVMRHYQRGLDMTRIGRNLFDVSQGVKIDNEVQLIPGFLSTTRSAPNGFFLCTDTIYRTLRVPSFLQDIGEYLDYGRHREIQQMVTDNPSFFCIYNKRCIKMDGIDFNKTPEDTFPLRSGEEISFIEYYNRVYQASIKVRNQPLLFEKKRDGQICYYVPELMKQTGLSPEMRIKLKRKLIRNPVDRLTDICNVVGSFAKIEQSLAQWGMSIDSKPLEVPSLTLNPPQMEAGERKRIQLREYSWNVNHTSNYREAETTHKWFVLSNCNDLFPVEKILNYINRRQVPGLVGNPTKCSVEPREFANEVRRMAKSGATFGAILLPSTGDVYSDVKMAASECGIVTQCFKMQNLEKFRTPIAKQITSKLKGAPWKTAIFEGHEDLIGPCIGIDVYHSPKQGAPSVAALVGTYDQEVTRYLSRAQVLKPRQEIVPSNLVEQLAFDLCTKYRAHSKEMPHHLLFIRDGVSFDQIAEVQRREIEPIRKALRTFEQRHLCPQIKLISVVILKRINERLFHLESDGSVRNPLPGTLVDKGILADDCFEFFLSTGSSTQGTASPIHVQVVHNDDDTLTKPALAQILYNLTYHYWNFTKPIKSPVHTHYAHKMAYHIGEYTTKVPKANLGEYLYYL